MGRWDDEHPAITVRFTPDERQAVSTAMQTRGLSAHDAFMAWAGAELDADELARRRDELGRLRAEVATLTGRRAALAQEIGHKRRAAEGALRTDLATLEAEREHLTELTQHLRGEVEDHAQLLARAGIAPDDPALGVLLAMVMLRPAAEAVGHGAVAEAFSFLRAAADELRQGRPEPTPVSLAESLLRMVRASERAARAEVRGRLWGASIALGARRRARSQGTAIGARWYLEHGHAPPEWTRLAEEAARDAGLAVTPETVGLFLRGAVDAVGATLADDGPDPEVRPAVDASG